MRMQSALLLACFGCLLTGSTNSAEPKHWTDLVAPETKGHWVRPSTQSDAQPVWGHADGLQVGLAPMPGPRGLLRIYAPYLGQPPGRVINFIAVEPVLQGQDRRSFSELEPSHLDGVRGKRFWSSDTLDDLLLRPANNPTRGVISCDGNIETLEVFVLVERFDSGAHPYLRLRFQSDRPHEVGMAIFAHDDSKPMRTCILTATMGNYARLRRLHLADRVVLSHDLWPRFDGKGFAPHRQFPLAQLTRTPEGHAVVSATTDESEPQKVQYAAGTFRGWKYQGRRAVQYWRCEDPKEDLRVLVNARAKYWASRSPIPGGISFENFEMVMKFRESQEFWFGVRPEESTARPKRGR